MELLSSPLSSQSSLLDILLLDGAGARLTTFRSPRDLDSVANLLRCVMSCSSLSPFSPRRLLRINKINQPAFQGASRALSKTPQRSPGALANAPGAAQATQKTTRPKEHRERPKAAQNAPRSDRGPPRRPD